MLLFLMLLELCLRSLCLTQGHEDLLLCSLLRVKQGPGPQHRHLPWLGTHRQPFRLPDGRRRTHQAPPVRALLGVLWFLALTVSWVMIHFELFLELLTLGMTRSGSGPSTARDFGDKATHCPEVPLTNVMRQCHDISAGRR